jgi:hypothetical protein
MSELPSIPDDLDLVAERASEERSERWIFFRELAIVFVLVALLVAHALLS